MAEVLPDRRRVVIEAVTPLVDRGRFAIKRVVGEKVVVEADVFADGHDLVRCVLLHRPDRQPGWCEVPMRSVGNDRWRAVFTVEETGLHWYTIEGWMDAFETWRRDLALRVEAGQDVSVDLRIGARLVEAARLRAVGSPDANQLSRFRVRVLGHGGADVAVSEDLAEVMARHPDREHSTLHEPELRVVVDRPRARFSSWYEIFPRSTSPEPGSHGTFKDLAAQLPRIADMGFDIVYLPPIHPIGKRFRKGRNNAPQAAKGDVGSPWAIGARDGGHKAIHPQLGTAQDFRELVTGARELGLEIALDIAFQCSPDHPYVRDHPEWFRRRPDRTIQYAENPPKKYQDIYPFDFETPAWRSLWDELLSVFVHWIEQGVQVFRVDNPHTKPFGFWEWVIASVKAEHPDVIFLSEAFTRPKVMYELAKRGFTQSYTYFAWRPTGPELREYLEELTTTEVGEFFRPSLWPNTPDILTVEFQREGRPTFMSRLVLAATLGASYGVYGPAYELCENRPLEPGKEEYLDSEKYQLRHWEIDRPDSLAWLMRALNRARRDNPALQHDHGLRFHDIGNDALLAYTKRSADDGNVVIIIVSLDPVNPQSGWLDLPASVVGNGGDAFGVTDLITGASYWWTGSHHYVRLDPALPAHVLRVNE